jgi:hypothetical protein
MVIEYSGSNNLQVRAHSISRIIVVLFGAGSGFGAQTFRAITWVGCSELTRVNG